jgi:hypothetical protein
VTGPKEGKESEKNGQETVHPVLTCRTSRVA